MEQPCCSGIVTDVDPGRGAARISVRCGDLRVGHRLRYNRLDGGSQKAVEQSCTVRVLRHNDRDARKVFAGQVGEVQLRTFGTELPSVGALVSWAQEVACAGPAPTPDPEAVPSLCFQADDDGAV